MKYGNEKREREGLERMEERFLRWVIGVEKGIPGYLLRSKLQREKLRGRAGKGA